MLVIIRFICYNIYVDQKKLKERFEMATLKDVRNILVELDEMTGLNGASLDLKQNNGKRVLASHVFQNVRDASGKIVGLSGTCRSFENLHHG